MPVILGRPIVRVGRLSAAGRDATALSSNLAEPLDEIVLQPGQLVAEQSDPAERCAALAETTRRLERAKNQIRDTSPIRLPRGRLNWRVDPTESAMRPVSRALRLVRWLGEESPDPD